MKMFVDDPKDTADIFNIFLASLVRLVTETNEKPSSEL